MLLVELSFVSLHFTDIIDFLATLIQILTLLQKVRCGALVEASSQVGDSYHWLRLPVVEGAVDHRLQTEGLLDLALCPRGIHRIFAVLVVVAELRGEDLRILRDAV